MVVLAEIGTEAFGGEKPARRLGMVGAQGVQLGLEGVQDLGAMALLLFRLLVVAAEDIAAPTLAPTPFGTR